MGKITASKKAIAKAVESALDMSQAARMERAREMGFNVDNVLHHGSSYAWWDDVDEAPEDLVFSLSNDGGAPGVSMSPSKETASSYANMASGGQGGAVGEFYARGNIHPSWLDAFDEAEAAGLDVVDYLQKNYDGVYIPDYDETRIFDPANIRSVNAAFDPAKKDSANLLASAAGVGVLGAGSGEAEASPAVAAASEFYRRRQEKKQYWADRRRELMEIAGFAAENVMKAVDKPLQGYLGMTGVAASLASGNDLESALLRGAEDARRPVEQTTFGLGAAVQDEMTGSALEPLAPAAATAVHAGLMMGSPL